MQIDQLYTLFQQYPSIQTDTRKLQKGDLYFALKGPNFNGNRFAGQALDAGAAYAVVDEQVDGVDPDKLIVTADVLTTLQQLAKYHRQRLGIPIIAITASNVKTTTKELEHEVLSTTYVTYTTKGNLNNQIGIPLTILAVKDDAELAVIEMGANHQHEIEAYCRYTLPTHGLITNCGKAHLEGFGGEEGVKKGKGELFKYLRNNVGIAFIMNDYVYLQEMSKGIERVITYGTSGAYITGVADQSTAMLSIKMKSGTGIDQIKTQLVGSYNLPNVLAAISIGKFFKVPEPSIITALEQYLPSNSRSQLVTAGTNQIILDAYNANPTSMKAAIENFASMEGHKKLLLLGGMMELGKESKAEHQALIELIGRFIWEAVVLVGGDFAGAIHPYIYFKDAASARHWLQLQRLENAVLLVKGSRSMKMETVVEDM